MPRPQVRVRTGTPLSQKSTFKNTKFSWLTINARQVEKIIEVLYETIEV